MSKLFSYFFVLFFCSFLYGQKAPQVLKTEFSKKVLNEKMTTLDGKKIAIKDILKKHKGNILIIDFWASWCKDCILALPKTKELMKENPSVKFVYFSVDRNLDQWKNGLEKYQLTEQENYWFSQGWKNPFNNYVDLNWVPRFIVVDTKGKIAKYYAISPEDPEIQKIINQLLNQKSK